jgi:hypothetical protein
VITAVRNGLSNFSSRVYANACCDQSIHDGMCYNHVSSRACQFVMKFRMLYVSEVSVYILIANIYIFQQLDLVSPFQLYFNPILIVKQYQVCGL